MHAVLASPRRPKRLPLPIAEDRSRPVTAAYEKIESKIREEKTKTLQKLEELVTKLSLKIDESIEKTTKRAYLPGPQPTSYLSDLLWTHSCEDSSEPISLLSYRVDEEEFYVCDSANISFQSSLQEIVEFHYENALRADLIGIDDGPNTFQDYFSSMSLPIQE